MGGIGGRIRESIQSGADGAESSDSTSFALRKRFKSRETSIQLEGYLRSPQYIDRGSQSEICGKAISSVMMKISQSRNQRHPL